MAMQQGVKTDSFPPVARTNRVKEALGINDLGGAMLRLTILLCSGLFLVMLLGGRDFGQLRPGLARADAEAKASPVTAEVPKVETAALDVTEVAVMPKAAPQPVVAEIVAPKVVIADAEPEPVAAKPENSVFTLSNYADPAPEVATAVAAEDTAEGEIWYVAGNSLNVRSGPSTNDAVVGKLTRGEAALVVWREGDEWARIRIEGDGVEGYVAMRFLTPDVPVVN